MGIANRDDVSADPVAKGHIACTWRHLGDAAGTQRVGVNRIQVEPGKWSGPVHAELDAAAMEIALRPVGQPTVLLETAAADRLSHLQRPDLGRRLDEASRAVLSEHRGEFDVALGRTTLLLIGTVVALTLPAGTAAAVLLYRSDLPGRRST